ncbi:MAG: histidine kinase [Capsulimonas sp.]|nr:histidine kinase [Capsulimonas sp.]
MNVPDQIDAVPTLKSGPSPARADDAERQAQILEAVLASLSDFIFALDLEGRHVFVGDAALRALGKAREDVLGKSLFEIGLPESLAEHVDQVFRKVVAEGQTLQSDMEALTSFGQRRFQYFYTPIFSSAGDLEAVLVNSRDITDERRALEALSESEIRFQTLLERCHDAIAVSKGAVHVYANRAYANMFGYDRAEEISGLPVFDFIAPSAREQIADRIRLRGAGEAIETMYITRGLRRGGEEFDMEIRVSTYLWRDEMYTLVILRDVSEERRRDSDLRQRTAAMKSHQDWLEAVLNLLPVGLTFVEPGTGRVVFANGKANELAGGDLVPALLKDKRRDVYACYDQGGHRLPLEQLPSARVAHGERIQGMEINWSTPAGDRPLLVFGDIIPALHGHSETGVVVFQDIREQKELQDRLAASYEREWLINWIGATIRGTTNSKEIPAATVAALGSALRADRCYFVFYDIDQGRSWIKDEWRVDSAATLIGDYRTSSHDSILQSYQHSIGQTLVIEDIATDARFPELADELLRLGLRSGIRVPLYENQNLVAVLVVAMSQEARAWTGDEVALTESVAAASRTAAEAARTLERERNIANNLQNALNPAAPSSAPGLDVADFHRAALDEASVGGDFYDVFTLKDGVTALVLGDVSGKGLAAAAQVATVRNMLRTVLYLHEDLAQAVSILNDLVVAHDLLRGFVTLFVGCFDAADRTLTYVSCGHEPGILQCAEGGPVHMLPATAPVLGIGSGAPFHAERRALSPGDRFLVYTDGLSEAGPDRTSLLGSEGLASILKREIDPSASALMARIMEGVHAWAGGELRDDACLLASVVK